MARKAKKQVLILEHKGFRYYITALKEDGSLQVTPVEGQSKEARKYIAAVRQEYIEFEAY
jgi:hypothetical protein